jgi:hypothetical protein
MGGPAQVKSIDALQAMSAALECFHDNAANALDELDMQIRRALQWIGHDCREYWNQAVRRSRDDVHEARLQLERAKLTRRIDEEQRVSCVEEKKALEKAKRRLQFAENKVAIIPQWSVKIERAINEYRASRSQFVTWLENDYPRAIAVLGRMVAALETYVRMGVSVDEHSPIDWASVASSKDSDAADTTEDEPESPNSES